MACSQEFVDYVCDQLSGVGTLRPRRMFGEWCVYVDDRPVVLVCDDTVYLKKLPELDVLLSGSAVGAPYEGAKEHWILDIDDRTRSCEAVALAASLTPLPKKRAAKPKK
jgi:TfoX/Sxy family transcriptional regulator of competence genes